MKRNFLIATVVLGVIFLTGCKCRFNYNVTLTAYDATKCGCCLGYKAIIRNYNVQSKAYDEEEFIVRNLTGELGKTVHPGSKFPIRAISNYKVANETCANVLDTLELYQPIQECPK